MKASHENPNEMYSGNLRAVRRRNFTGADFIRIQSLRCSKKTELAASSCGTVVSGVAGKEPIVDVAARARSYGNPEKMHQGSCLDVYGRFDRAGGDSDRFICRFEAAFMVSKSCFQTVFRFNAAGCTGLE